MVWEEERGRRGGKGGITKHHLRLGMTLTNGGRGWGREQFSSSQKKLRMDVKMYHDYLFTNL